MPPSLRQITRRLAAFGAGIVNTFLRDNKVLPPVLALLALLVFAWVLAGTYLGSGEERVSSQANVAQSQNVSGADPVAPEAENRDVDSYAAYRNKDPFRQLLSPAGEASAQPGGETTGPPAEDTGGSDDAGGGGSPTGAGPGPTDDGASRAQDTDQDGLSDTREAELAQDPQNPDTDGDGIPDGADDADGDGQPDGRASGGSASPTPDASASPTPDASPSAGSGNNGGSATNAGSGSADAGAPASDDASSGPGRGRGGGGGPRPGRGDDLLDSGGSLYAPYSLR